MINTGFQAFTPVLDPLYPRVAGLRMFVGPATSPVAGYVVINNVLYIVPTQFVNLLPLSITYVYLDLTNGLISSNNTGFTGSVYPIARLITNATQVTELIDYRPDILAITTGGGGGGGSSVDAVQSFTVPATISMPVGQGLFGTCVAAANPITLPSTTGLAGQSIKLIKTDAGGFVGIVGGVGGTYFLSNQNQYVIFETDGNQWFIIGGN